MKAAGIVMETPRTNFFIVPDEASVGALHSVVNNLLPITGQEYDRTRATGTKTKTIGNLMHPVNRTRRGGSGKC
jgi:hypothetical protein